MKPFFLLLIVITAVNIRRVPAQTKEAYVICYVNGNHTAATDSLSLGTLYRIDSLQQQFPQRMATAAQTGAVWGLAYQHSQKQLWIATLAKRHSAYGPLGTGGIYRFNPANGQIDPYLDLKTLGIDTGPDRHANLPTLPTAFSSDSLVYEQIGKVSLGGIDFNDNGDTLFVMNLYDRTLYALHLPADGSRPTQANVQAYSLPTQSCRGGEVRPFAVKYYQGKVYIGTVCDAQTSQQAKHLTATAFALNTATKQMEEVISFPLTYARGKGLNWNPWTDQFDQTIDPAAPAMMTYPQPVWSDIEFANDGTMLIALMDRLGHQGGRGMPDPKRRSFYLTNAYGDLLKAERQDENHYALSHPEREFFYEDHFSNGINVIHPEAGTGGLAYNPATNEVLYSQHEPTHEYNNGGVRFFDVKSGQSKGGVAVYRNGQTGGFDKANNVGDIELISAPSATAIVKDSVLTIGLTASPNPVREETQIVYRPQKTNAAQLTLELTDLSGRRLLTKPLKESKGVFSTTLNFSNYPTGEYQVLITEEHKSLKLIKVQ
ncbi:MAG: T9SS type A sorting domain-containing protein [Spirosomataceae bacterium]